MQFVTAATNLRAHVFSIPLQSQFEIKSIAGNIIPAIATTNAIVAGLQVCGACVACVLCAVFVQGGPRTNLMHYTGAASHSNPAGCRHCQGLPIHLLSARQDASGQAAAVYKAGPAQPKVCPCCPVPTTFSCSHQSRPAGAMCAALPP